MSNKNATKGSTIATGISPVLYRQSKIPHWPKLLSIGQIVGAVVFLLFR
jgi:hypothetical protein